MYKCTNYFYIAVNAYKLTSACCYETGHSCYMQLKSILLFIKDHRGINTFYLYSAVKTVNSEAPMVLWYSLMYACINLYSCSYCHCMVEQTMVVHCTTLYPSSILSFLPFLLYIHFYGFVSIGFWFNCTKCRWAQVISQCAIMLSYWGGYQTKCTCICLFKILAICVCKHWVGSLVAIWKLGYTQSVSSFNGLKYDSTFPLLFIGIMFDRRKYSWWIWPKIKLWITALW